MKTMRPFITALAVAFVSITPLRADEALDGFKKEMTALEGFIKEQEAGLNEDPLAGITTIRGIVGKRQSVKTDGLPADLKAGFSEFVVAISKMGEIFKGWPEKAEDRQAFIEKKVGEDPKYTDAFGEKMAGAEKELQPALEKLDALGKKYGLDGLGALAPGRPAVIDEKTALATFKTEVETVGTWIEEKQKSVAADPAAGMAMVGEIVGKLKAVKTDGLPADLKGGWGEMNAVLGEMGDVFKGMPKMMAIQAKLEPVAKKLQEIGKKYDLDMAKVAPGNK